MKKRKAINSTIVDIETLMYEMNSLFNAQKNSQEYHQFQKVLESYLSLPRRLKPLFDHCKKMETIL